MRLAAATALATIFLSAAHPARTPALVLERIGGYDGGAASAAEISAFDAGSRRLFTVNGALGTVDVLDLSDPSRPRKVATIPVAPFGRAANSAAAHDGIVAVAIEAADRQAPGTVAFFRAATLELVSRVTVGAVPDMVTFSPSGRYVLVANEAEPSNDYAVDPEGSVSIIDVSDVRAPRAALATFTQFDGDADELRRAGVRIYGPGARVSQDLEPEYITVSADERTAWVVLQENNALAMVDIPSATVTHIVPLGVKDHSRPDNGLDVTDLDGTADIRPWPVLGLYLPDAIARYESGGRTWLVLANEGDARAYRGFAEEARAGTLPLDPSVFTANACGGPCGDDARLGRLVVTRTLGRNPATGLYEALYVPGARSFSIRDASGALVWDSGDELERRTRALPMVKFNAGSDNDVIDDRSDDRGPEPEGVAVGEVGGRTFAFIGLDRVGGVMAYDVTDPERPVFAAYTNTRRGVQGDRGPEGVLFVPAKDSPSGEALLIISNEVSGTVSILRAALTP